VIQSTVVTPVFLKRLDTVIQLSKFSCKNISNTDKSKHNKNKTS